MRLWTLELGRGPHEARLVSPSGLNVFEVLPVQRLSFELTQEHAVCTLEVEGPPYSAIRGPMMVNVRNLERLAEDLGYNLVPIERQEPATTATEEP